jgi:hypothetical protein
MGSFKNFFVISFIAGWVLIGTWHVINLFWKKRKPSKKEKELVFNAMEKLGGQATVEKIFIEIFAVQLTTAVSCDRMAFVIKYLIKRGELKLVETGEKQ